VYKIGIDLGGTKIYGIISDINGKIINRVKVKTAVKDGYQTILNQIQELAVELTDKAKLSFTEIDSIGVAAPSAIDTNQGVLLHAPNLNWHLLPMRDDLSRLMKKPVWLDNDVNMGLYGEYHIASNKNWNQIYGIFVGTGVGGAYISQGELVRGHNFTAGEIGHITLKIDGPLCNCGQKGCLEAIAGKIGIIRYIAKKIDKSHQSTLLDEISPTWRQGVGSGALKKAWLANDSLTVKAMTRAAKALGIAAASVINLIGVDAIIFGGGVMEEMGDLLIPTIRAYMDRHAMANGSQNVDLHLAQLGDDSIALGAALYSSHFSDLISK